MGFTKMGSFGLKKLNMLGGKIVECELFNLNVNQDVDAPAGRVRMLHHLHRMTTAPSIDPINRLGKPIGRQTKPRAATGPSNLSQE